MEKSRNIFPLCGKNGPVFPWCGKLFSTVWKTPGPRLTAWGERVDVFVGLGPGTFEKGPAPSEKQLANSAAFCETSGSSEMIRVRDLFFQFSVLKSSPRERGVVLIENRQFLHTRTRLEERAQPWARLLVLCSCVGPAGPRLGHELGVASSFSAAPGQCNS